MFCRGYGTGLHRTRNTMKKHGFTGRLSTVVNLQLCLFYCKFLRMRKLHTDGMTRDVEMILVEKNSRLFFNQITEDETVKDDRKGQKPLNIFEKVL